MPNLRQPSTISRNASFLSRHGTHMNQREKTIISDLLDRNVRERTRTLIDFLDGEAEKKQKSKHQRKSTVVIDFSDVINPANPRNKTSLSTSKLTLPRAALTGTWSQKLYKVACARLNVSATEYSCKALDQVNMVLKNKYCSNDEILCLSISLTENSVVRSLSIIENQLDEKSVAYLCEALAQNPHIIRLTLSGNNLTENSVKLITELVGETNHIQELSLTDNHLRDVHGAMLADMITANTSVISLDLSYNKLGDMTAEVLGLALADNDSIRTLNLSWNCFRHLGIKKFAKYLSENVGLRSLNLSMNGLGVEGAGYMCMYLVSNETLISLNISNNRITDLGFDLLAKMVSRNTTLQYIYLGHNPITTTGANRLLTAFYNHKQSGLKVIDFTGAYFDKVTQELTEEIKQERPYVMFEVHGVVASATEMKTQDLQHGIIDHDSPLEILRFYVEKTGSRVVDVFKIFDAENRNSITKNDLVRGLAKINVNLTQEQVDNLFSALDSDGSGDIDFGELMAGDTKARTTLRKKGINAKDFKSVQDHKKTEFAEL